MADGNNNKLSAEEEAELVQKVQAGIKASKSLQEQFQGFIDSIVCKIDRQFQGGILDRAITIEDLFNEGYLAFTDAVNKFDPSRGFRLSTYAGKCIEHAVYDAINERSRNRREVLRKIREAMKKYDGPDTNGAVEFAACRLKMPPTYISYLLSLYGPQLSLDDEGVNSANDVASAVSVEDEVDRVRTSEQLNAALKSLPQEQEMVIRLLHGYDVERRTLKKVAEMFGKSTTQIETLEWRALQSLRENPDLSDFEF